MPLRKILSAVILILLAFSPSYAEEITSIEQLNDSRFTIGVFDAGPCTDAVNKHIPQAKLKHIGGSDIYIAVKAGKVDAVAYDNSQMAAAIRDGLEGVKILPGSVGELFNGAGISRASKIPGLREKFNQFLREIKQDGTISSMLERWIRNKDYKVPDIPAPSTPQFKLTVATTGIVMPFSFYEGNNLAGFDIELARRFALWLGAGLEFKVYGFGGAYAALRGGDADCLLSNLQITDERKENVDFSDPIYVTKIVLLVRGKRDTDYSSDEFMPAVWSPSESENDNSALIREYNGKNIAVGTGSIQSIQIPKILPQSKITYLDTAANLNQALRTGKVDAVATDDAVAYAVEREYEDFTHADGYLSTYENAFVFPKRMTERQKKIADEMNEYLRRIKSDGTLKEIHAIWFGDDESRKIIADYENLPAANGTLHIAAENDTQPYTYVKNNTLVGYEVDIITRFCREKGYRPDFMIVSFSGLIPAVQSGKSDVGMCSLTITPERQEAVNFSEPTYKGGTVLLIRKSDYHPSAKTAGTISESQSHSAKTAGTPESHSQSARVPMYKRISELDGKPVGLQMGTDTWVKMLRKKLPHSQLMFYNTLRDLIPALKTHKIEAFIADMPVCNLIIAEDSSITKIDERININKTSNIAFAYAKTAKGKKLCDEMSEYIRGIKASGELDELIAKWEGSDESAKTIPDYKNFPAPKGILSVATEGEYPPLDYFSGNKIVGLEIDIAARFCEAYGYGLKITAIAWDSIIPAVVSGKYDIAAACFEPTKEHEENIYFSEPFRETYPVMVVLADTSKPAPKNTPSAFRRLSDLDGKPIGMQPGVIDWEKWVAENLPHSKIQYYNTYPDLVSALKTHKIEGFLVDSPVLKLMAAEDKSLTAINEPVGEPFGYSFCYAKTDKGKKLCDEMSGYIRRIKASGELDAILSAWQGTDESAKVPPDFASLPAKNGTLTFAAEGSYPPFTYYKGTKLAGIDLDIAVRFCRAYGYGLKVQTMLFDAMIPAINSGKADFAGDFTPSEEHEEALYYSEPYCNASSVMAVLADTSSPAEYVALAGKRIGVQIGTTCAELVPERIPSAKIEYYNSLTDQLAALRAGKVDAICCSLPAAIYTENEDPKLTRINPPLRETYLYPIFASTEKGRKLCNEYSAFLKTLWDNGTIDALNEKWLGADESKKTVDDYSSLPSTNGKIIMAVDTSLVPFAYVKDNRIVGYDIDLAVRFCKSKGYALEVQNMPLTGVIASVKAGKSDFMQSVNKTPERAENTLFASTPAIKSGNVLLTVKTAETPGGVPMYTDKSQLAGKKIGAMLGTLNPEIAKLNVPSAEIQQFDSMTDTLVALKAGKVDAICVPVPVARFMLLDNNDIAYCGEQLTHYDVSPIFPKTDAGRKLCAQFSEFIKPLWEDGTIQQLDAKWFSKDDSKKVIDDYSHLPNPNGTLKMAVDLSIVPFVCVMNGKITGYDVDCAVRFCRAYGYGLEIVPMSFGAIIPALQSGKCDFAMSSFAYTEERAENVLFSYPNAKTGNVFLVMKTHAKETQPVSSTYTNISQLNGKRIGVTAGSIHDRLAKEKIPDAEIVYFNSNSDILPALLTGKIDAIACGESTALFMIREGHNITYLPQQLGRTNRKAAFAKTERGRKLCKEYSDFLKTLWDNGTIKQLVEKWIDGEDDSKRVVEDYSNLPHPNGIITMAVDPSVTPYLYTKDKRIQGYEIDLAVMFCKAKGYGLKVDAMSHNGVLAFLETGKCDFSYGIDFTDEREMSLILSDVPNTDSSNVIVVLKPRDSEAPAVNMSLSDFEGKKIGVITGTNNAIIIKGRIPSAKIVYYESPADMLLALKQGKIDAMSCGIATSAFVMKENPGLARVSEPLSKNYHSVTFTSSDKGLKLRDEYSEFLTALWEDGTIEKLFDEWINNNGKASINENYSQLPATNGTLKMAADVSMIPFVYMRDNRIVGYDVELAVMFCKAKGYGLEIVPSTHSGVLAAVASGKCDFSYAMEYTEERAKSVLFSEVPNVEADNVLVVMKHSEKIQPVHEPVTHNEDNAHYDEPSFWEDIASSFNKTFIREERWKLFSEGIINTMIITVSAIFCGMLLGFTAFMFCRTGSKIANVITKFSVWLIKGTPIVVLLMILYYVIFGHVNISGIIVSIIAFTLTFGTAVYRMLTFGTGAVDRGQTEAAYALGFTDMQTFFTVILPQAALHFMPSFKEEVTALIKSTSVVGYIAVQDLTKMGDIVRSRTYEAFFPLIAVAVIYFILAGLLNIIVNIIHTRITPSKRKPEDILRGINLEWRNANHD